MSLQPSATDKHALPRSSSVRPGCGWLRFAVPLSLPLAAPMALAGENQATDPMALGASLSFSIEVLSRGGGVPEAALNALRLVREDLETRKAGGVTITIMPGSIKVKGKLKGDGTSVVTGKEEVG